MRYMNSKRRFCIIVLILMMLPFQVFAGGGDEEYIIEGAGTGIEGTYLVKVTLVSKKILVKDESFVKCAIHGVLFRGFDNKELRQHQRALTDSNLEKENADFYTNFFKTDLSPYAEIVEGSRNIRMTGKTYHISSVVQVFKDKLRHDLEENGVIKKLTHGF